MLALLEQFPRWIDFQKNYAGIFYSRSSAAQDRGDYSPACALLGLILSREGERGYDLSEDDYVNLLDDYLMVSLRYFTRISDKLLKNGGAPDREILFLVRKPLQVLIDFLPDCQEKRYRDLLKSVMKEYSVYGPAFEMFLPEYQQACGMLGM